jgi:hypothetical protein
VNQRSSAQAAAERAGAARQVAVYLTAHQLAKLSELMLLADSSALQSEIRKRARELLRLLDAKADARRFRSANVIDLHKRFRLRALNAALGGRPDPPSPRRAA